jgi:hypothetical protein
LSRRNSRFQNSQESRWTMRGIGRCSKTWRRIWRCEIGLTLRRNIWKLLSLAWTDIVLEVYLGSIWNILELLDLFWFGVELYSDHGNRFHLIKNVEQSWYAQGLLRLGLKLFYPNEIDQFQLYYDMIYTHKILLWKFFYLL